MMAHDPLAVGTLISKIMQLSGPQGAIYTHRESLLLLLDAHGAYAPAAAANKPDTKRFGSLSRSHLMTAGPAHHFDSSSSLLSVSNYDVYYKGT